MPYCTQCGFPNPDYRTKCFKCAEPMSLDEQAETEHDVSAPGISNIAADNPHLQVCPFCRGEVVLDARKCRHCGEWLDESECKSQKQQISVNTPNQSPVPDSFAVVDYRFAPCPLCGKPVRKTSRGNPPRVTCQACSCSFLLDRRGGISVICPACGSTDATGGGFPFIALLLGMPGIMLAESMPTKYRCRSCDRHSIGQPGADMVFGFFVS